MSGSGSININEFLLDKTDNERINWLCGFLNALIKIHSYHNFDSLLVRIVDYKQYLLEPYQEVADSRKKKHEATDISEHLFRLYPRYDRYLPEAWNKSLITQKKHCIDFNKCKKNIFHLRKAREKSLHRCIENNETFSTNKSWSHFQVIRKGKYQDILESLLKEPNQLMHRSELIGHCAATTISLMTLPDGKKVVVKRYNSKSKLYSLTRSIIDSRAKVCWKGAELLNWLGIKSPVPLAMLEQRSGPWIHTSYLITEFIPGVTLSEYFEEQPKNEYWSSVRREVEDFLLTFPEVLVAHGDFKSTNFMVENHKTLMIDLDSMKSFRFKKLFIRSYLRDIDRFERNWVNSDQAKPFFQPIIDKVRNTLI
ncbi:hypothetical protein [Endozoicomonas sp. 4G]|uniref:hypothetical protein n=1 Tax=Endozoicomonas sp. 4G TaxID=2872754 RepID=UPI002078CE9E|nr:hypothetical protein [Endozoicomonas sp. 4G]